MLPFAWRCLWWLSGAEVCDLGWWCRGVWIDQLALMSSACVMEAISAWGLTGLDA